MEASITQSIDRIENKSFDLGQCLSAMHGKGVPDHLGTDGARAATIREIRCQYEFATSPTIVHLCVEAESRIPQFIRARNARLIMSNIIPDDMNNPVSQPYCIWYPDVATEGTYRKLANEYPAMRYHVGRVCAAGGYAELYAELDLLPDVSIAEEARESKTDGSRNIFETIMAAPAKYAVMDNYTRSLYVGRWNSASNLKVQRLGSQTTGISKRTDQSVGTEFADKDDSYEYLTSDEVQLLYNPLPLDLPTVKKDLLMLMAAYEGNIDRYARLCRPHMNETEVQCVIRGIYHHTMFVRWWSEEISKGAKRLANFGNGKGGEYMTALNRIKMAINARRIRNGDISGFTAVPFETPYLIWWPLKLNEDILSALAKRCPTMKEQIAITCIF